MKHWVIGTLLACVAVAHAGVVQMADGTVHQGAVSIDRGILVRGNPSAKVALNNIAFARFTDETPTNGYVPGLVLTNGARIAGEFAFAADGAARIDAKRLRFAAKDVAWAVHTPFDFLPDSQLFSGAKGALLPGGDFFEGTIKAVDAKGAKVLNPIFGPRTFAAAGQQLHAAVFRGITPQPAAFEVLTRDGSRYLASDVTLLDSGGVALRHPHYDGLQVPAAELVEIRAAPSRMIVLGELKPSKVTETAAEHGPAPKANQGSRQVAISGSGSMTWRRTIRGGQFLARLTSGKGDGPLVFVVEADGRVVYRSAAVASGMPALAAACPFPAAESVTLRVEGGSGTGVWADPVILLR